MNAIEPTVTICVPAKAEYVDLVRLTLYGVASKMGFLYEEIEDMKVAVSEACNNAVLHAYGGEAGTVRVGFTNSDETLVISVKDNGRSFDASDIPVSPTLSGKPVDQIEAGGLGLYLMQALMDQVVVRQEEGTEVILSKRLVRSEEMA